MPRKLAKDGMVEMLVSVPQWLRAELQAIKTRDGVGISQQVRLSLQLWVNAVAKNPHGALGLLGNSVAKGYKLGNWAPGASQGPIAPPPAQSYDPGPEPSQSGDPAAWAKWSAKAGNAAIAKLAKGEWPED